MGATFSAWINGPEKVVKTSWTNISLEDVYIPPESAPIKCDAEPSFICTPDGVE